MSSSSPDENPEQDASGERESIDPSKVLGSSLGKVVEASMSGESVSPGGLLAAIGGWRGVLESLLPATVYLTVYVITKDARLSAIAPLVLAAIAIVWRLLRKEPLVAALSGVIGVVVCVAAVMFSGEGSSYFVPGFYINGAWILAHAISLIVGWPLVGLLFGVFRGSLTEWRGVAKLKHAAIVVTVIWIVVFAARLAVQLPLFFADQTGALGVARLVMGVPLFALAVLFTWLVLSRVSAAVGPPEGEEAAGASEKSASSDERHADS